MPSAGLCRKPGIDALRGADILLQELHDLQLPQQDFAVFGSGPLIVRRLIPASNDIDVLCRGDAWEHLKRVGERQYLPEYDVEIVTLSKGRLTFGTRWGIGDFDVELLIDTAEIIDDLPFVQLQYVVEYKTIAGRPKDHIHLQALQNSGFAISDTSLCEKRRR